MIRGYWRRRREQKRLQEADRRAAEALAEAQYQQALAGPNGDVIRAYMAGRAAGERQ